MASLLILTSLPMTINARTFVNHHLGQLIGLNLQLFDFGHQIDHLVLIFLRNLQIDGGRIQSFGSWLSEHCVNGVGNPARGGKIGIAQGNADILQAVQSKVDFIFNNRAVGDSPRSGNPRG